MKISVAMTTFNGERYLAEQLESIAAQTRLPDELVVHDDKSTDRSVELLHDFKRVAPFPVRIVENQQNLGFTANFGAALGHCEGELIFLADQDDRWFPNKIAVMESVFRSHPDLLIAIHDGELGDENLNASGISVLAQVRKGFGDETRFITGALTVVRHALLKYALPIPTGIIGHDGWLHYVARMLDARSVIDVPLQTNRRHSSNTSSWIASSIQPINRMDVLRHQRAELPASSYADRLVYNDALLSRLDESLDSAISARIYSERKAILQREELLSKSWLGRKISATGMLVHGDYSYFNGLRSFIRDCLR
jgi:glycosyltransferase involved in cell wall biosynthesis